MSGPTRTIEIIRAWSDGMWDTKPYQFPGSLGDPPPSQAEIVKVVLLAEPLDTNEDLVTACLYCLDSKTPEDEDAIISALIEHDVRAMTLRHLLGLDDPDYLDDCDPETWHQGGYYDGSAYDA